MAEALPEVVGERPLVGVFSVLDDKDAAAMLGALLPSCSRAVFTRCANPRALPAATLESLASQLGGPPPSETVADPQAALARARELAGPDGAVLATGSIYLIADLVRVERCGARLDAVNEREYPSLLTTIGIVAAVVAAVILVFFGIGYLIGRLIL